MDLLDNLRQEAGNKTKSYRAGMRGASRRKTPAMLLARLPSPMKSYAGKRRRIVPSARRAKAVAACMNILELFAGSVAAAQFTSGILHARRRDQVSALPRLRLCETTPKPIRSEDVSGGYESGHRLDCEDCRADDQPSHGQPVTYKRSCRIIGCIIVRRALDQ